MLQPTQTHCQRSASSGRAFPWVHLTLAVRRLNRQPQPLLLSVPQTELPMFYKPLHPQGLCKTGFCGPGSLGNITQPVTFQVYKWRTQGPAKPCGRGLTGFASHVSSFCDQGMVSQELSLSTRGGPAVLSANFLLLSPSTEIYTCTDQTPASPAQTHATDHSIPHPPPHMCANG